MSLVAELKRRNVIRIGMAYLAVSWLVVQVVETLFPVFHIGDHVVRAVVIALGLGFLPACVLAWLYEWTAQGVKRDADAGRETAVSQRRSRFVDRLIVVVLLAAIGFFAFDKFVLDPARDAAVIEAAREQAIEEGRSDALGQIRESSIAVLPFQDLSQNGDQQFLCDGLAQDILNDLSRIAELRVTARSSAFSLRDQNASAAQIGDALNVAYLLEGSVTRSEERVRVDLQLVDTRLETTIWSAQYDEVLDDIFAMRDAISESVVAHLPLREKASAVSSDATKPEAYLLTLRARAAFTATPKNAQLASDLLTDALAIDPDYVPALLESIYVNYHLVGRGYISEKEELRRFQANSARIQEVDPVNGMMLALQGVDLWEVKDDLMAAAQAFSKALADEPGNVEVIRLAGLFARRVGKYDVAVALLERVAALDPLYLPNLFHLAQAYLAAGRYDEALTWFTSQSRVAGGSAFYHGITLLLAGDAIAAREVLDLFEAPPDHPQRLALASMIAHDLGELKERDLQLAALEDAGMADVPYSPYLVAQAFAWRGDTDAAFLWIDKGLELDNRYGVTGWWLRQILMMPMWRKLEQDVRWAALRERLGMSPERLAAVEINLGMQP